MENQNQTRALFILNPKAGSRSFPKILADLEKAINNRFFYKIVIWDKLELDLAEIIDREIKDNDINLIVAGGGDGTFNRIAPMALQRNITFSMIPFGSGNGLARFLKISRNVKRSAENIVNGRIKTIDVCKVNNEYFLCSAGIGFDAYIGYLFSKETNRGFKKYLKLIAMEFTKYKAKDYTINIDGKVVNRKAFLITFANANQWGNNAIISPKAKIDDGLINICILKPFRLFSSPLLAIRILVGTIDKSKHYEHYTGTNIEVSFEADNFKHYDGEAKPIREKIAVRIIPEKLKLIVNK